MAELISAPAAGEVDKNTSLSHSYAECGKNPGEVGGLLVDSFEKQGVLQISRKLILR